MKKTKLINGAFLSPPYFVILYLNSAQGNGQRTYTLIDGKALPSWYYLQGTGVQVKYFTQKNGKFYRCGPINSPTNT